MFGNRKGQSSIEYVTTYGWMLLAVSLVGGTMYTQVDLTDGCSIGASGFSPPFPTVGEVYQYENETVFMSIQNPSEDTVTVDEIRIDEEGERVGSFDVNREINGEASAELTTNRFYSSENCFTRDITIEYDTESLSNLTTSGELQGKLGIVPLIAEFDISPGFADPGQEITFNASSSEGNNEITSYSWSFGDGNTSTNESATHTYSNTGVYTVTLEIEDDEGITDTRTQQVYIGGIIRKLGGNISQVGLSNTAAIGCIGNECSDPDNQNTEVVTTDRAQLEGTLVTQKLLMLNNRLCVTDFDSMGTDEGCSSYTRGEDTPLSEQNTEVKGSFEAPVIKPGDQGICLGPTENC